MNTVKLNAASLISLVEDFREAAGFDSICEGCTEDIILLELTAQRVGNEGSLNIDVELYDKMYTYLENFYGKEE
jgi:hypothetical protein